MKYACNKCLKVTDSIEAKRWLKVKTVRSDEEFLLCPECEKLFWLAVDCDFIELMGNQTKEVSGNGCEGEEIQGG